MTDSWKFLTQMVLKTIALKGTLNLENFIAAKLSYKFIIDYNQWIKGLDKKGTII